jgi:hypothetical protein
MIILLLLLVSTLSELTPGSVDMLFGHCLKGWEYRMIFFRFLKLSTSTLGSWFLSTMVTLRLGSPKEAFGKVAPPPLSYSTFSTLSS